MEPSVGSLSGTGDGASAERPIHLDVVICTHNREALLRRAIESLNAASLPEWAEIRIVVVANACSDGTTQFLADYQRTAGEAALPLEWREEHRPGKSYALNRVLSGLTADVVAFVDDDHRVAEGYLCAVAEGFREHTDVAMLCGRVYPDWDGSEPAWVHDQGPYRIYPLPVPNFDLGPEPRSVTRDVAVPGGGNLAIRRSLFERVGPFGEDLGPVRHNLRGAEDVDWVVRALSLGARLHYVPGMTQYHFVDADRLRLRYLMRKAYLRSASMVPYGRGLTPGQVPLYMYRKIARHSLAALTAWRSDVRRFHLVRLAASLGEWKGFRQRPLKLDDPSATEIRRDRL